jgi:hypothetical protein
MIRTITPLMAGKGVGEERKAVSIPFYRLFLPVETLSSIEK